MPSTSLRGTRMSLTVILSSAWMLLVSCGLFARASLASSLSRWLLPCSLSCWVMGPFFTVNGRSNSLAMASNGQAKG
ncbi:hypothetical protein D3C78_1874330 [compost metagenome]